MDTTAVPRIAVDEARRRVLAGDALLVCAYQDEAKCARMKLDGSITVAQLESRLPRLGRDRELIFYCA
jgi:hypothetical protein